MSRRLLAFLALAIGLVGDAAEARVVRVAIDRREPLPTCFPSPTGRQTGWNWRHPSAGAPDALAAYRGSYLPFGWTKAERETKGDPRPSVEERYRGREDYLGRVAMAAVALAHERFLLPQDLPFVLERAAVHWDGRAASAAEGSSVGR